MKLNTDSPFAGLCDWPQAIAHNAARKQQTSEGDEPAHLRLHDVEVAEGLHLLLQSLENKHRLALFKPFRQKRSLQLVLEL